MSGSENADASLRVILVHGTWGRGILVPTDEPWVGTYWFNEGSQFRNNLEGKLKERGVVPQIEFIPWSGSNSILARSRVADTLRAHLDSSSPNVPQVVIGHSHGGNIALRAVKDSGASRTRVHIVTLATPFLQIFAVTAPPYWRLFGSAFFPTFFVLCYIFFGASFRTSERS